MISVRVELERGTRLRLEYALTGELAQLAIPRRAVSGRAERLWEHTCFEAFIAPAAGARYCELNFSPSTAWAAYAFDGYRQGMRPLELGEPPTVRVNESKSELRVTAAIELGGFTDAPWPWRIGLTAVVEDRAGGRAYYALLHPRAKPDFHDAAAFTVLLDRST
ncbi:MAG TPA: DOMON-like domain-containing protein [Rhodanobacteraceae bacterium]|nr:DOMON-like domain-containing protein [Rhodanobacteraceae bacterium]